MSGVTIYDGPALGTHWWVKTITPINQTFLGQLSTMVSECITRFQSNYTRFTTTSLVGQLNELGSLKDPPDELREIILVAEAARHNSNGLFNIGVGLDLVNLGYDSAYSFKQKVAASGSSRGVVQTINEHKICLTPGSKVDLGGVGKGWLIDKLDRLLLEYGLDNYYLNGGGDIMVRSKDYPQTFALENPFDPSESIGKITLAVGAIASSSGNRRTWPGTEGASHHHLINTSTGQSHNGPAAVFTYGRTATSADLASTILFLATSDQIDVLAKSFEVEYLIVDEDGTCKQSVNYPGILY